MKVETVFRYRTLAGKCDLGCGLDWDEIEEISVMEHTLAAGEAEQGRPHGRRHRRAAVRLTGFLRGDRINDRVEILDLGPGGLVCRNAPYIANGEEVEIAIDEGDLTYRFRARGAWLTEDGDDYRVGLAFLGTPVVLRRVVLREHAHDVVDQIAAAA